MANKQVLINEIETLPAGCIDELLRYARLLKKSVGDSERVDLKKSVNTESKYDVISKFFGIAKNGLFENSNKSDKEILAEGLVEKYDSLD